MENISNVTQIVVFVFLWVGVVMFHNQQENLRIKHPKPYFVGDKTQVRLNKSGNNNQPLQQCKYKVKWRYHPDIKSFRNMSKFQWSTRTRATGLLVLFVAKARNLSKINLMDLGCGSMMLKNVVSQELVKRNNSATFNYYPVDAYRRDNNTIVCDLNSEFPYQEVENYQINLITCISVLTYLGDKMHFLRRLKMTNRDVILTVDYKTRSYEEMYKRANFTTIKKVRVKGSMQLVYVN